MGRGRRSSLTAEEKAAVWPLVRAGANWPAVAAELGRSVSTVMIYAWSTGGVQPRARCRSPRQLTLGDREEISRGIAEGLSMRSIAASIGRPASTVCREIRRNGGSRRYRGHVADQSAWAQGRRPKLRKLAATARLSALVED